MSVVEVFEALYQWPSTHSHQPSALAWLNEQNEEWQLHFAKKVSCQEVLY